MTGEKALALNRTSTGHGMRMAASGGTCSQQLLDEAGLADAGLAAEQHEGAPARSRLAPRAQELLQLGLPSHQRREPPTSERPLEAAGWLPCRAARGGGSRGHAPRAPRRLGCRAAPSRKPPRTSLQVVSPDQHLARPGLAREPCSHPGGLALQVRAAAPRGLSQVLQ